MCASFQFLLSHVLPIIISSRNFFALHFARRRLFRDEEAPPYSLSLFRLPPGRGSLYDSPLGGSETVSEHEKIMFRMRICGPARFNANNDAIMYPDTADSEFARALTSSQMRRDGDVNVTRARRHVKFARGNASVPACLCTCVNDRAKSALMKMSMRGRWFARKPHGKLIN